MAEPLHLPTQISPLPPDADQSLVLNRASYIVHTQRDTGSSSHLIGEVLSEAMTLLGYKVVRITPDPADIEAAIADHGCGCHYTKGVTWYCGLHADGTCYMDTNRDGDCGKRYCPFCGEVTKGRAEVIQVDA
jgi:hypothetical protein